MPTWFARRVLDVVGKASDVYYRLKYGAMARRLGRSAVPPDDQQGFILLQIDGLAHSHLVQALDNGVMPYVNRQIASGRLAVAPWRCGLPSSTPAVQAGVMFGNRFDIPGFRWYEKESGTMVTPQRLDRIRAVHDRISEGQQGILSGGSCYVSVFDGDADLALFTLSTLRRQRFFESMRGIGLLGLFVLSPFRVLRVLGLAAADYVARLVRRLLPLAQQVGKRLGSRLRRVTTGWRDDSGVLNPLDVVSPLIHAVTDAVFTEVQTFGVMLDIYRCSPAIYANYNGYDEVAHELGPDHPAAFRVLRGIDKRIHQIDRMRAHYRKREYDLYLMSDHGNTPAVPFARQNGSTLGQHIVAAIGEGVSLEERMEGHRHASNKARCLREELRALEESASPRFRNALATARHYLEHYVDEVENGARQHIQGGQRSEDRRYRLDYDMKRQKDVVVSASGPLAHVYFNVSQRPLDMVEVLLLYPELLDQLTTTRGIGAVIGRARERTIVLGKESGALEIGTTAHLVEPPNPLAPFGDVAYAARQVHRLAHFPHAGDLIVLGDAREDGKIVTFETQVATHGGLGGSQTDAFIIWPTDHDLRPDTFENPEDLYPHFMRYQDQREAGSGTAS